MRLSSLCPRLWLIPFIINTLATVIEKATHLALTFIFIEGLFEHARRERRHQGAWIKIKVFKVHPVNAKDLNTTTNGIELEEVGLHHLPKLTQEDFKNAALRPDRGTKILK